VTENARLLRWTPARFDPKLGLGSAGWQVVRMQSKKLWLAAALCCASAAWSCTSEEPEPGGGAGGSAAPPAASGDVPCAVATLLEQRCAKCHGTTLRMGAPMSLVRAAHFQALKGTLTYGALTMLRVQDAARPMPQPPDPRLMASEIETLRAWIDLGAPADAIGCAVNDPVPTSTAGSGGAGGAGGSAGAAGAGTGGAGGTGGTGGSAGGGSAGSGATTSASGWPMFGRDLSNSRNNPDETALSPSSVPNLRMLWKYDGAATTSTPAVVDGIVYLPTWDGNVQALRHDDGSVVWRTPLPDLIDSSPAITDTTVFVSDDAGSVHALDRASGMLRWSKRVEPHPEAHLWSSPVYVPEADLVIVGVASGEEDAAITMRTFRGSVVALRAQTGDIAWQLYTTDDDASSGAGIAVWASPAVDTTRKLVFIGTGNNYVAPTGRYADSLLAINYETGALAWWTQFTAEDVFVVGPGATGPDSDIGSTANLFTAAGKDLVGIGVKNGIYYALERDAGTIVWMQMITAGAVLGGVISASAYANDSVFVASNQFQMGQTRTVALDAATGQVRWEHVSPMITYGGVAHANGVAYVGTTSGMIYALDAVSGAELWSDQLPDAIAGSPTVADGTLLVPWGYQWTLRQGPAGVGGLFAYGL
jgi:polyvinyl alcohol dehydrogenase (cytochrome)